MSGIHSKGRLGDDDVRSFHAVDLPAASRTTRSHSHSAARAESWMAKVTGAMSQRIFPSKKLGGSRSTQVAPMDAAVLTASSDSLPGVSPACSTGKGLESKPLRQVVSEANFFVKPTNTSIKVESIGDSEDESEVETLCPSVACDVMLNDTRDNTVRARQATASAQSSQDRRGQSEWVSTVHKVAPKRDAEWADDDDEAEEEIVSVKTAVHPRVRSAAAREADATASEEGERAEPAPVLKDFFSRTPSVALEMREHQRQAKREAHYRSIRERQQRLRVDVEHEQQRSDADRRQLKAQQLRRLNVQRRLELRCEAAAARVQLVARAQEDQDAFLDARERWERDFQDEIRELSSAFRKAHARNQRADGEVARPMTVAGLAAAEAVSELQRAAGNFDKRVKSAGSASPRRCSVTASGGRDRLTLEDSSEVFEVFEDDLGLLETPQDPMDAVDVMDAMDAMEGVAVDVDALLGERANLLRRVADIDRVVALQQRLHAAGEGSEAVALAQ